MTDKLAVIFLTRDADRYQHLHVMLLFVATPSSQPASQPASDDSGNYGESNGRSAKQVCLRSMLHARFRRHGTQG